jgi:glutathione peroxidase
MPSFFDFKVTGIDSQPDLLGPLRGKVILAVNVASRCGYTPQYTALQQLHEETAEQGFAVVGFPCNQFGAQEPGTESEIKDFCMTRFGVTFPLSSKVEVNGPGRHPVYAWMTSAAPGEKGDIHWNFEKFLIGRDGAILRRYPSGTKPTDAGLMADLADAI